MLYVLCVGLLVLLQVADYHLTMRVLAAGGYEANPLVEYVGVGNSKVLACLLIVCVGWACWSRNKRSFMLHATWTVGIIYSTIVLWSMILLKIAL